jgi:UDP-N-acetylmuramoyl-L-alanyl-D-glutamate--2,6-diaminopimelate ligase
MGEIAGRLSNQVVATSDNPRTEAPLQILAEIEPGLQRTQADYMVEADRRRAIYRALSRARKGDIVVIAGKGHEDYQIIGTQVLPFDDRVVARELIMQLQNPEGARN